MSEEEKPPGYFQGIVDQHGRPIIYTPGRVGSKRFLEALDKGDHIPHWIKRWEDIEKSVNLSDWEQLSSDGRTFYGSNGIARALIDDKAANAVADAFAALYTGTEKKWGRAIAKWLNDVWAKNCAIEGAPFTLQVILFMLSTNSDHSGDAGVLFTTREGDEWPLFQLVPAHRIRYRSNSPTITEEGRFHGMKQEWGVIKSKVGTPVGYCLLGDTAEEDQIVSTDEFYHFFDPCWIGQSRGWPVMFHGLRKGKSMQATDEAEEAAALIGSRKTLTVYKQSGALDDEEKAVFGNGDDDDQITGHVYRQEIGGVDVYRAGGGERSEMFHNPRPGADWESYQDRGGQLIATGTGYPLEMVYRPRNMNGTIVRQIQGRARRCVTDRQGLLMGVWMWMIQRAVSWAVLNDVTDEPAPSDWMTAWKPTLPAQITIDDGRDAQARREDVAAGHKTWATALGELGIWDVDAHFDELVEDQFLLEDKIRAKEKERGYKLDRRNFIMRTPNEPASLVEDPEGDGGDDDEPEKRKL